MGASRKNGVDVAIALIGLLADRPRLTRAELIERLQVARASLHRVTRELSALGLLELSRGSVRAGPLFARLLKGHQSWLMQQIADRRRPRRRNAASMEAGPLMLAAPPKVIRRRGGWRVGFSNASLDNLWRVALVHSIERAAAVGSDRISWLGIRHAGNDPGQQRRDVKRLIKSGIDGLLLSAVDAEESESAVEFAARRGIPVVLVDRPLSGRAGWTSRVTGDNRTLGRTTALWLAEMIGGRGSVLLLPGREDAEPARQRLAAAREVFGAMSGIEIIATAWTDWQRQKAFTVVSEILRAGGPSIAGVWCDSGLQGAGSLQAFLSAGMRRGQIPPHTGGDLNLVYKLAHKYGVPLAGVEYPPEMGAKAMDILLSLLSGRWVPRELQLASDVILSRGHGTFSVKADRWIDQHVRWDLPDDLVLESGLGTFYDPRRFRIHYHGNRYNRSAASASEVHS